MLQLVEGNIYGILFSFVPKTLQQYKENIL